jgi:hypothetical protein
MARNDWHSGVCDAHGKRLYPSKKKAKAVIRRLPKAGAMRAYRCTMLSDHWHVGRLPQAAVCGVKTVREVYGGGPG